MVKINGQSLRCLGNAHVMCIVCLSISRFWRRRKACFASTWWESEWTLLHALSFLRIRASTWTRLESRWYEWVGIRCILASYLFRESICGFSQTTSFFLPIMTCNMSTDRQFKFSLVSLSKWPEPMQRMCPTVPWVGWRSVTIKSC